MTKKWAFIEHVTNYLGRGKSGDARHPTLWPSEATALVDGVVYGKCRRAIFFRYVQDCYAFYPKYSFWKPLVERLEREKLPADRYMQWIWAQGNLYEEYLIDQSKNSGVFLDTQVPVYIQSHNISGKIDLEVLNPFTGKRSIVESKSVYGFASNGVLGTPGMRSKGQMGEPKDSNLMQIAIYDWWRASEDTAYEESRLVYGSRDTGRYGEFLVTTETVDNGVIVIKYKPFAPYETDWVAAPYTINDILDGYKYVQQAVDTGSIPARDFNIQYNEEQLKALYDNDELPKTVKESYEKVIERRAENEALVAEGKKPKKELKQVERGDWQCEYCSFNKVCFDDDKNPREV